MGSVKKDPAMPPIVLGMGAPPDTVLWKLVNQTAKRPYATPEGEYSWAQALKELYKSSVALPMASSAFQLDAPVEQSQPQLEVERLKREKEDLELRHGRLKSQLQDARREVASATRQFDQLLAHLGEHQKGDERKQANLEAALQAANSTLQLLTGKALRSLRMIDDYPGEVVSVEEDAVQVAFEVDDDIIHHRYGSDQFVDRQLPHVGDALRVFVHLAVVEPNVTEAEPKASEPHSRRSIGEDGFEF